MDGKEIFRIFGFRALYGHDTLQNLIDLYMLYDPKNFHEDIPFIFESTTHQTKIPDAIQLSDLIRTREFFLKNIKKFIGDFPSNILSEAENSSEKAENTVSTQIANSFLFPIINMAMKSKASAAEKAIFQISKYFNEHEWNGENDIPSLTDNFIQLLSQTFLREDVSSEVRLEAAKVWLEVFNRKGKLDDIMLLLKDILSTSSNFQLDLSNAIENIKKEIISPSFITELNTQACIPFYSNMLVNSESLVEGQINIKKAAASNGFLYVFDEKHGLFKLGTGQMGTTYSSLEMQNKKLEGHTPVGIAATDDYIIIKWENGPLVACDQITLEISFYILENGQFSNKHKEVEKTMQFSGIFTAVGNKLLFLEETIVYEYELKDDHLEFVKNTRLEKSLKINNNSSIITNGNILLLYIHTDNNDSLHEFNLQNGSLLQSTRHSKNILCNPAFDPISRALFSINSGDTPTLTVCSPSISLNVFDCTDLYTEEEKGSLMELFCSFPSLMLSKLVTNQVTHKYKIEDITIFYDVLKECTNSEYGRKFITPIIILVYIYILKHPYSKLPSPGLVKDIWKYTRESIKPYIIKMVFGNIREPYNSQKVLYDIMECFPTDSIIKGVGMIDYVDYDLLLVLLEKNNLINEAAQNLTHEKYTFLQKLITTITHGYFMGTIKSPGLIIPIFTALTPSKSHLFLSTISAMLPVLKEALKDQLIFCAILPSLPDFIQKMYDFVPVKALEKFARHHMSVCTDQPFSTRVIVDETPHPYHNNTDYVHIYNFKNAIEVAIVFDQATNTEANCDWLQIFSDEECLLPISDRMSGRFNRWKPSFLTHAKVLAFKFHSDTSVNEWGYKATITHKVFSQQNYESPDPMFDIYFTLYNIIIERMKNFAKIDDSFMNINNFDANDYNFDSNVAEKLKELVGDADVGPLSSLKIATINHLYKYAREINDKELLTKLILCPFTLLNYNQNINEIMVKQMLFYIPSGLSKENRKFLLKSIKNSSQSQEFIDASLDFATKVFDTEEPLLTDCAIAADKSILAFKLMDEIDQEKVKVLWFKCLKAISRIKTQPNSTTPSISKVISKLGLLINVEDDFADEFAKLHFNILRNTTVNTSETDAPVVSFIITRISSLKVGTVKNSTLLDIVLTALQFNLPNTTNIISKMIDKYNIKTDVISPLFEKIILKIGMCFEDLDLKLVTSVVFDTKKNYSYSLAKCARKLLTRSSMNSLTNILYTKNALGALIMLSARSFPLIPGNKVMLKDHNIAATITSIDPIKMSLITDNNIEFSVPLIDFRSLTPMKTNFEQIPPPLLIGADRKLINAMMIHKNNYIALAALSELLPNADCNFSEVFKQINSINTKAKKEEPKFKEYEEMEELINSFPDNEGIKSMLPGNKPVKAYTYTQSISVYYFEPEGDALFGFCEEGNPLPDSAFLLRLEDKTVSFGNTTVIGHETIKRIKLGYFNETMMVYIHTDNTLKPTELFLPPMNNPIPCIITRGSVNVFDPHPLLINPIVGINYQIGNYAPTHAYISNNFIPISTLYEEYNYENNEPTDIILYPQVSKNINRFYIEFTFNGSSPKISLTSSLQQTLYMYTYNLPDNGFEIAGLLIDNEKHFAAVTIDGEIAPDSVKAILDEDSLILFSLQSISSFTLNSGMMPFLFDEEQEIEGAQGEIVWGKPKSVPICPLQSPITYKQAETKRLSTGMLSPYIIQPNEKVSDLTGRVGYGICNDQKVTVFISGDLSGTITPVTTLYNNVTGVIESISDSFSSYQRNLFTFNKSYENLPINENSLMESNYERYKLSILTICLSNASININPAEELKFIKDTITSSSFKDNLIQIIDKSCFSNIISTIFGNKDVLEAVCNEAVKPFLIDHNFFSSYPTYTLCPNSVNGSKLTLNNAEYILFVTKRCVLKEPKKIADNYGGEIYLSNNSHFIYVFKGDTIIFEELANDDTINAHVIPLCKPSPNQPLNFNFGINFISQFISYIKENPEDKDAVDIYDKCILFPLWKKLMNSETRIFINDITNWLIVMFDGRIFTQEMLIKYRKALNLETILNDQPSYFTGLLCFISMFLYKGPLYQNFIEYVIDSGKSKQSYATIAYRQIATEMLDPFNKKLLFDKSIHEYDLISSIVIDALVLSKRENTITIRSSSKEPTKIVDIKMTNVDSLAFLRVLPETTANVKFNQNQITPDCIHNASVGSLKITKSVQDRVPYIIEVIPVIEKYTHNSEDARKILVMLDIIRECWTPDNEALAMCFAQTAFSMKFPYLFAGIPDPLLRIMFPNVDPEVARFRCAICFIYLNGTEKCQNVNLDANLHPSLHRITLPFIPSKQLILEKAKDRQILPSSLPIKNAKYSDFFADLYTFFENVPGSDILKLGEFIIGPSNDPTKVSEVLTGLENDMFVDGEPNADATSSTQISGFLGFGMYGAVCFANGNQIPVDCNEEIISAIVGSSFTKTTQLTAIRLGAEKIESQFAKLKIFREGSQYYKYFCISSSRPNIALEESSYASNIISSPIFLPYINKITKGRKIKKCIESDKFEIFFDEETNILTIPSEEILIKSLE